jgi:hypothetical protein
MIRLNRTHTRDVGGGRETCGRRTAGLQDEELGVLVVHDGGQVAAVVEDHVRTLFAERRDLPVDALLVLGLGLTLPGIDRRLTRASRKAFSKFHWPPSQSDTRISPKEGLSCPVNRFQISRP